jgi:hypothetical protein
MATINMLTISAALTIASFTGAPDELLLALIALNLGNAAWILLSK